MSSWRDKLSGITNRAKEAASSSLNSVRESATSTFRTIKSIATDIQSDVKKVVGEIVEPKETTQAVTPNGQVYTVAVDAGFSNTHTSIGGSRVSPTKQESAEERERRELKAMLPTNKFMGGIREEASEIFSSISESVGMATTHAIEDSRAAWDRVGQDWTNLKEFLWKKQQPESTVNVPGIVTPRAYAPTILNMSADDTNKVKPKKRKLVIPDGELNYNESGTGKKQIEPPKGPEGPQSKYKKLAAALAIVAGSLAAYMYADGDFNNTHQAPTASAKAPDSTPPAPTTTENKTTKTETPAPIVTSEPEEPKKVEVTPPKEVRWTGPVAPVQKKYSKTIEPPKKTTDIIPKPPKKEATTPAETHAHAMPDDVMKYGDAVRLSAKISESLNRLQNAAGDSDLGRPHILYEAFNSYTGKSNPINFSTVNDDRGTLMLYLATAENIAKTYDANMGCLEGANSSKADLQCDAEHVWTLDNLEKMKNAVEAGQRATMHAKYKKQMQIIAAQQVMFEDLYKTIDLTISKVRDSKKQDTLRSRLITLSARAAMVNTKDTTTDPLKRLQNAERNMNKIRGLIAHAELLRGDASTSVVESYHYKIKQPASPTRVAQKPKAPQNTTAQNKVSTESESDLRNWTPDSI